MRVPASSRDATLLHLLEKEPMNGEVGRCTFTL
jgi:hypothetical protein